MEDVMEKIEKILSDEESMKQISELAQMFMNETGAGENNAEESSEKSSSGNMPDMGSLMKLSGLMGAFSQSDKNTELLLALKPHLKEEKQQKVDKAIKILKLLAVWNVAKESGMLNDIL